MAALKTDEFLDYLKRSELLEPEDFEAAVSELRRDAPDLFADANLLASELVKRKLITGWHVRQLMKRKHKGFYLRQYRILGHLGSGGMSSVYLGEHTVMKRRVAIKVLPKRKLNAVYLDRFMREAQAIASLDHPHIVRAYDVDRFEDVHYIVMEYFEGQNLRQLVEKEGPLAYEDAANYIRQAALGLGHAHRLGVVHRDVKPENILVNDENLVKILDLGLALLDESNFAVRGSSIDEDKILGTADYLAPEQALDSHNVDARADIYGLGATLYFCLTGSAPFPVGTISERLLAHQRKEPASIFLKRPDAPADLVEICAKMMAKKPENRFQSALQVVDVAERWLIRHGFAKASDFSRADADSFDNEAQKDQDFDAEIFTGDVEERFLANESATESGFQRGKFRLSSEEVLADVPFSRNLEGVVDLYDASETGSIVRRRGTGSTGFRFPGGDDFLLSQRADAAPLDPLELALSEIADTTKTKIKTDESNSDPNLNAKKKTTQTNRTQETPRRSAPSERSQATPGQTTSTALNSNKIAISPQDPQTTKRLPQTDEKKNNTDASDAKTTSVDRLIGDWYKEVPIWFWTVAVGGYALAIFLAGILFTLLTNLK